MDRHETTTVLVGVTGGIAAYKSCELVRALIKRGYHVKVVMTDAATQFVTPLTFRTLTNEAVAVSLWEDDPAASVHHISLAEEADVFVIAPCTANVIAKLAHGRADDLLTTTVLATEAPIVIAPAMNVHMWRDEVTQSNVAAVRARGVTFVEPAIGELACGDVGEGRLASVEEIVAAVVVEAERACDLAGRSVLVTAGGTQEPIDPVRYIGNRSSGKTGFAVAAEAARRGARVTLVAGPTHLADPFGVDVVRVQTALEMHAAVMERVGRAEAVIASAAVADFRPIEVASGKIKKSGPLEAVELVRNPDILAELGEGDRGGIRIGFAAETSEVELHAREKLEAKRCHMVVANDVSDASLGFGTEVNRVLFVTREGTADSGVIHKRAIAREICDRLVRLLADERTA